MIIKKFQAKNEMEAMALAQKELGNNVTMIHSRTVKPKGLFSFLKKPQVEVTVAKEEEMDRPEVQAKTAIAEVNKARKKAEEESARKQAAAAEDQYAAAGAGMKKTDSMAAYSEKAVEEKLDNIQSL